MYCKVLKKFLLLQCRCFHVGMSAPFPSGKHRLILSKNKKESMNVENAKSQMRKGMLEYCVLLLLSREAGYANYIIGRLKEAELIVVEGTLYPLLTRLKKDGLLQYEWRESTQGPPRKYYALTDEGRAFLNELDGAWNELAHTVSILKEYEPQKFATIEGAAVNVVPAAEITEVPAEIGPNDSVAVSAAVPAAEITEGPAEIEPNDSVAVPAAEITEVPAEIGPNDSAESPDAEAPTTK